jgi:hypothetical protein
VTAPDLGDLALPDLELFDVPSRLLTGGGDDYRDSLIDLTGFMGPRIAAGRRHV